MPLGVGSRAAQQTANQEKETSRAKRVILYEPRWRTIEYLYILYTHNYVCMDGWMGGWMGGCMDGWMDGWMNLDGWMDG